MTPLESMLDKMRKKVDGSESLIVLSDDPRLQELGSAITDEIDTGPPILSDRGGIPYAIEEILSEGKTPVILLWSMDMEEFGNDLGLESIAAFDLTDPEDVFQRPTLSFLSRYGPFWEKIPRRPRAVYDSNYSRIAKGYLDGLRRGGLTISATSAKGDISSYFRNGTADIGIGVLKDEALIADSGSWPLDRISPGRPVIAVLSKNKGS